jgi:predicted kinase
LEKAKSVEIVVLTGIPGSGKSTMAKSKFANYVRINLDTIKSRAREEKRILEAISGSKSIVIDNTNLTRASRKRYVDLARKYGAGVRSIYLVCPLDLALERNSVRKGKERVPDFVVKIHNRRIEVPSTEEGFESVEVVNVEEKKPAR